MGADLTIEVAYATPQKQKIIVISAPAGTTLSEAIDRSAIQAEFPDMVVDPDRVGVFGRKATMDQVLRDGDRVEIYRPLIADPKEARRKRAEKTL
jgi:putative ubiquitin-RnfH superfamily antitoxin RatB of RatAB toxin-antitoxin module